MDRVSILSCMERNEGVVGCGHFTSTAFLFSVTAQGATNWIVELLGNSGMLCEGIV